MQAHGHKIPNTKPIPKPEANQYPTPFQKPIVDTNSGGIRIIPIQVDPGYQPRRDANIVFGERYYAKFGINIDVVLLDFKMILGIKLNVFLLISTQETK